MSTLERLETLIQTHSSVLRSTLVGAILSLPIVLSLLLDESLLSIHSLIYSIFTIAISFLLFYKNKLLVKAYTDSLTGLFNRDYLNLRLDQLLKKNGVPFCVLLMDLDRFKMVNDTLGHTVGDKLLVMVAQRLKVLFSPTDAVVRLGGDEFAIVMPYATEREHVESLAKKILDVFAKPFDLDDTHKADVCTSIGIALSPFHSSNAVDLLRCADVAMYYAKRNKGGFAIYTKDIDSTEVEMLALSSSLRTALIKDEMEIYYQPKKTLHDGKVNSVEALIRWNHPSLGLLTPDKFIPLAEQTGIITILTPWVIRNVIKQLLIWDSKGLILEAAVNISTECLKNSNLLSLVSKEVAETGIDPSRLTLEVTETSIMSDPETSLKVLMGLDILGIKLSVDDFGTGHSSLLYLKHLPIKEIKIDRVFVSGLLKNRQDQGIIASTINLGKEMNCIVVAEGVEDRETLTLLDEMHCDVIQGYYLSRPIPAKRITKEYLESLAILS